MEKELKSLLISFEKAKEWDWSDMIQWINKVKALVDAFQGDSFPEKITLERRLWQCLNPSLPQGLHSITLKIYESILSKPWLSSEDFGLFLTGILPFFQYTSPENRCQVLSILSSYYKGRISEMKLSLQGVVISLLPGLDQDSNIEVENKTCTLLDELALKGGQHELFYCVWHALLTTPRVRLGALNYLFKRIPKPDEDSVYEILPNKQLVINSLIATLADKEMLVKRTVMDLLKAHFPINISEEIITTKEKIILIESVLKIFLKTDMYVTRRIWEWIFQGESQTDEVVLDNACELLIEAMKNIFNSDCNKPTDPIEILEQLLSREEIIISLMKELMVPLLIYAEKFKDDQQTLVLSKCITLLRRDLILKHDNLIWEALAFFFEENLYGNLIQAIKVIKFYFNSFSSFTSNLDYTRPLFESILLNLHNLGSEQLLAALELALTMVARFEPINEKSLSHSVKVYQQFFVQYCREDGNDFDSFLIAAKIAVIVEKFVNDNLDFEWIECLEDFTKIYDDSNDSCVENTSSWKFSLIRIDCLIELLKKGSSNVQKRIQQSDVMITIVNELWDCLSSEEHHQRAVDLLIEFEKVSHDNFTSVIESKLAYSKLIGDDSLGYPLKDILDYENQIDKCLYNINIFTLFWKTTSLKSIEILQSMFSKGEVIRVLIQHLDLDLPEISHKAGQWLIEILPELGCVLKPIFNELLENVNHNHDANDFKQLSNGLRELRQIVKHGGDMIIRRAYEIIIPESIEETLGDLRKQQDSFYKPVDTQAKITYLQLMVEICLLALVEDPDPEKIASSRDVLRVKVSACEFLLMILRQKYAPLAFIAVQPILFCLNKSFEQEQLHQEVLHLQLLNILNIIFFDCDIFTNKEKCRKLVQSELFCEIYLKGLTKKDNYIKFQWINFIKKSFPLLVSIVSLEKFNYFILNLITCYCKELEVTNTKEPLIWGLRSVLHTLLLEKIIPPESEKIIIDTFTVVIEQLVSCCKPCKTNFEVSTLGTKAFIEGDLKYINNQHVVELLKPIIEIKQHSVMTSCFQIWLKISLENNPGVETNEKLMKLIGLIISLDTDANLIFYGLKYTAYLTHTYEARNAQNICRFAHFVYTLSCFIPVNKFNFDLDFWEVFVDFCKEFDKSDNVEVTIWINEIINLLLKRLANEDNDKSSYKNLYDYVQKTLKALSRLCLLDEKIEVSRPYPPSLHEYNIPYSINSGALVSLKSTLFSTVSLLWRKEPQEKIIWQFQASTGQLLQALIYQTIGSKLDTKLMSELIASLLTSGKSLLAKIYRKEIMDFFYSPYFFKSLNGKGTICLEPWSQIIRSISNACYGDRYSLITELLNKMTTGLFTSRVSDELRQRSLKCISFAVYSGQIDEYLCCTQMICQKLIEFIKIDDFTLKQHVYHHIYLLIYDKHSLKQIIIKIFLIKVYMFNQY